MNRSGVLDWPHLPPDRGEIARYAGCPGGVLPPLLEECLTEAEGVVKNRVAWRCYPVSFTEEGLDLGFAETASRDLARNLLGCENIVLFAATAGPGLDQLVRKYSRLSPAKAQLFQAVGAERVETLCDAFCREFGREIPLRPRYSPGYGDLPLSLQRDVFAALNLEKALGLTLGDNLLITPTKTVTAIAGW
ncbi:MAG: Vitamin B12 dependent methionine synthase activation subunit [Clostridia bacterium]|nr:Vitamin B12 dependent methionine synthase activation subunit [Clostridia bacterium]